MKDAYYFSHDSNAHNDMKIKEMRCVYGYEGYGWYWVLVELMRDESDYKLKCNGKYAANIYSKELNTSPDIALKFIKDCIEEFGLFKSDDEYFWSDSLLRRMEHREEIRKKRQEAGKRGGKANAKQMLNHVQANAKQERKGKEIKENIKEKKIYNDDFIVIETEYFTLFKNKYGHEPDYSYKRDRGILKRFIEKDGKDKLVEIFRVWFKENIGEWHGFTITGLQKDYNKVITKMGKKEAWNKW